MHSNCSEYDSELQIPTKKKKLSLTEELSQTKEALLSKLLFKEIQQEINLRKEDLELIEENIFLIRQKLIHLKQVLVADYYQQKNVKGFLQYPPHPAVKDSLVGKSPSGFENSPTTKLDCEAVQSQCTVSNEIEPVKERATDNNDKKTFTKPETLLEDDKLPCYIAPKIPDNNVIKPNEPRDLHSKKEIRIIVGNVSKWLAPSETSDATHKWTVYAKIGEPDLDISLFVNKVVFFLHKSYRPNDVIEVKIPPFKLTRRGWGEFPLKAQLHFKTSDPPIDVMHHLKLDHVHTGFETFGAETSLTVWVHYPLEYDIHDKDKVLEFTSIKSDSNGLGKIDKYEIEQFLNKSKASGENCFYNSNVIDDVFSNSFVGDECFIENVNYNVDLRQEHFFEPESNSSLSKALKCVKLVPPLCEKSFNIHHDLINEKHDKETKLCSNENSGHGNQLKNEEKAHTFFNEYEMNELFTDECVVVGEEVVIDCDENDDGNQSEFIEEQIKKTNFDDAVYSNSFLDRDNMIDAFCNVAGTKEGSNLIVSSTNAVHKFPNKESHLLSGLSNSAVNEVVFESSAVKNSVEKIEMTSNVGINNKFMNKIINNDTPNVSSDQKINCSTGILKTCSAVINGEGLSPGSNKKKKKYEKKSMIITLQKENGQIILRKEAKIRKCKDNNSFHKIGSTTPKGHILVTSQTPSNSKFSILKHNEMVADNKKYPVVKLIIDEQCKHKQIFQSGSNKETLCSSAVQKRHFPGVSPLKKVKTIDQEACEDINTSDFSKRCPSQNTEIAINWLMKKFPLVDARTMNVGFHSKHPYCAKDRETFLKWPLAKQRAAEWMRAKAVGRIINTISNLDKWTTLEILDWARVRCYTPMRSVSDCSGPSAEPYFNFVYQPRIDGILEFLNKHKVLTEEEVVDVVSIGVPNKDVSCSGSPESTCALQCIPNESDTLLPLDPELQGYKSFINKCMMNAVGESPFCELLQPGVTYPAVERVLISIFSSLAEELIRRSHNASWIRHCDNPPPEISVNDVKAAILSRKEFDFLLPHKDNKGREQLSVISLFRK